MTREIDRGFIIIIIGLLPQASQSGGLMVVRQIAVAISKDISAFIPLPVANSFIEELMWSVVANMTITMAEIIITKPRPVEKLKFRQSIIEIF